MQFALLITVTSCSSLADRWPGSDWIFWSNPFLIVPNAPAITGTVFALTVHILLTSISRSLYLFSFSVPFVLMFEPSAMAICLHQQASLLVLYHAVLYQVGLQGLFHLWLLLLLLSSSSSSSSPPPLCRVFTFTYLKQTMLLRYTVLQLFYVYNLCYI